jgi:hypothetical protein
MSRFPVFMSTSVWYTFDLNITWGGFIGYEEGIIISNLNAPPL